MNWDLSPQSLEPSTTASRASRTVGNIDLQLLDFEEKNKKLVSQIRAEIEEACNVQDYLERQEEAFEKARQIEGGSDGSNTTRIGANKAVSKVIKRGSKLREINARNAHDKKSEDSTATEKDKPENPEEILHSPAVKEAQVIQNVDERIINVAVLSPTSVLSRMKLGLRREVEEQEKILRAEKEERIRREEIEAAERAKAKEQELYRIKTSKRQSGIPRKGFLGGNTQKQQR